MLPCVFSNVFSHVLLHVSLNTLLNTSPNVSECKKAGLQAKQGWKVSVWGCCVSRRLLCGLRVLCVSEAVVWFEGVVCLGGCCVV